jgi:hypothetical protein
MANALASSVSGVFEFTMHKSERLKFFIERATAPMFPAFSGSTKTILTFIRFCYLFVRSLLSFDHAEQFTLSLGVHDCGGSYPVDLEVKLFLEAAHVV